MQQVLLLLTAVALSINLVNGISDEFLPSINDELLPSMSPSHSILTHSGEMTFEDLGTCGMFAIESRAGVTFDGRQTHIFADNVGVSPGTSITGDYVIGGGGSVHSNTGLAMQCSADIQTAYAKAASFPCPPDNIFPELSGRTIYPGVYCSGTAMTLSAASVTFDGLGDYTSTWIFQAGTTFMTATGTSFILQNGAHESNIYWALGTAATIGYSSSMVGIIMAQSAISFGHDSVLIGRAFAGTAVTFESGSMIAPPATTVNPPKLSGLPTSQPTTTPKSSRTRQLRGSNSLLTYDNPTAPALGACAPFALEAGSAMTFNGRLTTIAVGSIGVSPGSSITGVFFVTAPGAIEATSTNANACAADRQIAYDFASKATCSQTVVELSGLTLTRGVYCSDGAMTLSASALTLDGSADDVWIFQMASTLITSTGTQVTLINGALSKNVFWNVGSSATLGYASMFVGTINAYAAISFEHDTTLNGRGLAGSGVSFESGSVVVSPEGPDGPADAVVTI